VINRAKIYINSISH